MLETTEGMSVLKGYMLPESKEICGKIANFGAKDSLAVPTNGGTLAMG
jgi:hypothetical protein